MSDHRFYYVSPAGKMVRVGTPDEGLAVVAQRKGYLWLDYCAPTQEELSALITPLGLHPLAIEDCLDENQIPKIEDYPAHTFMLFNAFQLRGADAEHRRGGLFLGANFLVTVNQRDEPDNPCCSGASSASSSRNVESVRQGPAFLLHVILDHIVDQKFVAIEALEEELNDREEAMLADAAHFSPAELLHLRRDLLTVRKSLFHEREILVKIMPQGLPVHHRRRPSTTTATSTTTWPSSSS